MATQITVPTTADLPKDWTTTAMGIIGAIIELGQQYLATQHVTWYGALIAIGIAVGGYFLGKATTLSPQLELDLEQKIEKIVADLIAKQPVGADVAALAEDAGKIVQQVLAPPAAASSAGATAGG